MKYLSGKNTVELGKEYEINPGAIYNILKRNNVQLRSDSQAKRKYDIDELFFDTIDTQESAYFLGILYADGCNSTENYSVRLIVSEKDCDILYKLKNLIFKCDRPLLKRKGKLFNNNGKTYLRKDSYCLTISNKHISSKLESHGLIKAKSLKLTFPTCVPNHLLHHFIRGYFDGDGCLSFTSNQISISILGTDSFIKELQSICKNAEIKSSICHAKKGSVIKQISIHGNVAGKRFLDFIYRDSVIHLDRKYNKFIDVSSRIDDLQRLR